MDATPRPWRLDERIGVVAVYAGEPQECLAAPAGPFIHVAAGTWEHGRWKMDPVKVADAALIVEAVNAYDRLRAIEAAARAYVAWQYRERGAPRFTLTDLRTALEGAS